MPDFIVLTNAVAKNILALHRNIIIMVCIEGRRYLEVSQTLQIPIGTVRSRLSRAREQLQLILDSPYQAPTNNITARAVRRLK